jgi:two-component system, LytTR family, sensor kinase
MSRMRKHLIIFGGWTFVSLFFSAHIAIGSRALGRPESFFRAFSIYMTCAVIWFLFTPLIVNLSQRFRLAGGGHPVRNTALHLLGSMLFSFGSFSAFILLSPLAGIDPPDRTFLERLTRMIAFDLHLDMLRYWGVVAIEHVINYHRQAREREVALAEAKLEVLKRQLQPHFLFNTLNSISVLMFENVQLANRMLLRLSELLRAGLTNDSPHEVSLERELAFLERYLDIERIRFGDRLTIDLDVEQVTLGARVPNLILQPIVENAIKYGVAAVDRPSTVSISAQKEGDELVLRVLDDGPGIPRNARRGVGLSNTEARLRQLYGEGQKLELTSPINGGVLVSIAIPFRPCAS